MVPIKDDPVLGLVDFIVKHSDFKKDELVNHLDHSLTFVGALCVVSTLVQIMGCFFEHLSNLRVKGGLSDGDEKQDEKEKR